MVASQFAPGRAVAAAIVAVLLMSVLPVPTAQAQARAADVFLTQGEAAFYQGNFQSGSTPTSFIDGGTLSVSLKVPVHQTGGQALTNLAVYWALHNTTVVRNGCVALAELPGLDANGPGTANISIPIETRDLEDGVGYNVTVKVGRNGDAPTVAQPALLTSADCGASATKLCGVPPTLGCLADPDEANNKINAYFVKGATLDLAIDEIRWCPGIDASNEPVCDVDMDNGGPLNVTATSERPTYFETVVLNTGTWANMSDYGGRTNSSTSGWHYEYNVSLTGAHLSGRQNFTRWQNTTDRSFENGEVVGHDARSMYWDLLGMAGPYNVTVKLDPRGLLRRAPSDNAPDTGQRDADVMYRDFDGAFAAADLRTDPENPYPYSGTFYVQGNVTFRNNGTAALRVSDGAAVGTKYIVYIDNLTDSRFNITGDFTSPDAGASVKVAYQFQLTSVTSSNFYIPPGRHTLRASIDRDIADGGDNSLTSDNYVELTEANNNFSIDFFVQDATVPVFLNAPKITVGLVDNPSRASMFPHDPFNVFANVTDDDAALTVVANFTLDSDPDVYREMSLRKSAEPRYVNWTNTFGFHNFTNATLHGGENWTLRVRANDSFGNNVTSTAVALRVIPWPLHYANNDYLVDIPTTHPNSTVPWAGEDEPRWRIRVEPNMTGYYGSAVAHQVANGDIYPNQQSYVDNMDITIQTPRNITYFYGPGNFTPRTPSNCFTNSTPTGGTGVGEVDDLTQTPPTCTDPILKDTFDFNGLKADGGPGEWNWSIAVRDVANNTKYLNGTLVVVDSAPDINDKNVSVDTLVPGGNFTVTANVSDDVDEVDSVHVNFTRIANPSDGAWVNLTLTNFTEDSFEGRTYYTYNSTFQTGRGTAFGLGGTFNVTIAASDLAGNWNMSSAGTFNLTDEDAPTITGVGAEPAIAQVGENVTYWARVEDATNVTLTLEIFRASATSELLLDPIKLNESADGNFTFTTAFADEGSYAWRITPEDSVKHVGALSQGTVIVRHNVGPRFDVRTPASVIDGVRYGSGTPRIDIIVHDIEGVELSSISLSVAGQTADYDVAPAPGNLNGFLISYEVPASRKFSHENVVVVNITAVDNSSEALESSLGFTFTVDDVAPIARLGMVAPSYRDQPAHVLNVSLSSRFTLTADDNDGVPTDVTNIRYRILGGGPSAETVYTAPFKINDAAGVYTGPRLYQIQFWAEDSVGNFNRNFNTTTVYVDDTPPALFQFFPQGRSINATFVDDRVGVNRSVVWYRLNDDPYVPLPLVESEGAWTLSLPEGVKEDRVSYYLQAWDRLDNTETFGNASAPYASFRVDNHEPKVRITAPVDGSRIFRSVDLTWEASDEDGDALVFTIYYKAPGRANFVELAKIENSATRRYTLDTARYPDGQYTFRIAAGDGGFVKLAETTVTILNRASAVGVVNVLGTALPGETMLIKAEITKAEAIVEARLYLGGKLVDAYPMNDEGRDGDEAANDGFYSVRVLITAAGDYSVEIFTQYREDGELKESSLPAAATFNAKLTPGYILAQYGAIIALIGLLAAVGIGVAVFVVMRRR